MSYIGFHGSYKTRLLAVTFSKYGSECSQFHRIAGCSARAMSFDIVQFRGGNSSVFESSSDGRGLPFSARRNQQPAGTPVILDRAAADDRMDGIAIREGAFEQLQYQDGGGFASHIPICRGISKLATVVRREHTGRTISLGNLRPQNHIHAANQG